MSSLSPNNSQLSTADRERHHYCSRKFCRLVLGFKHGWSVAEYQSNITRMARCMFRFDRRWTSRPLFFKIGLLYCVRWIHRSLRMIPRSTFRFDCLKSSFINLPCCETFQNSIIEQPESIRDAFFTFFFQAKKTTTQLSIS